MAATVTVKEGNGASVSWNTVTAIRFCTTDAYNPGLTYPIPIPTEGFNYSYWKTICLNLAGTFTKINNIRFYTDGTIGWNCGTNGGLFVCKKSTGDNGIAEGDYDQAAGTQGTSGYAADDETNGHSYYKTGTANFSAAASAAGLTSGSPLTVDTTDYTATGNTKGVVLQVKVAPDATQGDQADETLTFKYDEI